MTFDVSNFNELQNAVHQLVDTTENKDIVFCTEGGFNRFRLDAQGIQYIPTDDRGFAIQ